MSHQILLNSVPHQDRNRPDSGSGGYAPASKAKKTVPSQTKKKKKKQPPKKPVHCKSEPTKHYRLNLAEIPFVAGKVGT